MTTEQLIARYQRCVIRLLGMFDGDPLPSDHPAHFFVERLEALIDLGLIGPSRSEAFSEAFGEAWRKR